MTPRLSVSILAAALAFAAGPALAADPVVGLYKTQTDDNGNFGHIEIYECGSAICGVIRKAFDNTGTPVKSDKVGKRMLWDMQPEGQGVYGKGKIWSPDRDKTYRSKMTLDGQKLKVSGCVFGICRGQTWTRLN